MNVNMFASRYRYSLAQLICTKARTLLEPPAELLPLAKELAPQKNYRWLQRSQQNENWHLHEWR